MSQRVKVRRLTDEEGQQLQRIVRLGGQERGERGPHRRAMVVLASAGGNAVEVFARSRGLRTGPSPTPSSGRRCSIGFFGPRGLTLSAAGMRTATPRS
jgi:hypothetical protein